MTEPTTGLARLRAPFGASKIGLLPKITCGACSKSSKKVCNEHIKSKCDVCGNYLTGRHIHIEYVGHGAVTDRLLEVDPEWNWEPCGEDHAGQPVFVVDDGLNPIGLWIKLTVLGVTRRGYGSCEADQFDAEKVLIGDAIRNAAMRFGVALDLWIKGQADDDEKLSATDERGSRRSRASQAAEPPERRTISSANAEQFAASCAEEGVDVAAVVREATNGRTGDPAEVLIEEMPKLRDARRKVAAPEPDGGEG